MLSQVYGDPYVAARQFYLSLMASACDPSLIGISYARFYVGEYVRYPSYLCVGWHDHYGVRSYCRGDCAGYRYYRVHAADPFRVLHPRHQLKYKGSAYAQIARVADPDAREIRSRYKGEDYDRPSKRASKSVKVSTKTKSSYKTTATHGKVVRSSKDSFVKSKQDISAMRKQLKKQTALSKVSGAEKKSSEPVATKTAAHKSSKGSSSKKSAKTSEDSKKVKRGAK